MLVVCMMNRHRTLGKRGMNTCPRRRCEATQRLTVTSGVMPRSQRTWQDSPRAFASFSVLVAMSLHLTQGPMSPMKLSPKEINLPTRPPHSTEFHFRKRNMTLERAGDQISAEIPAATLPN